MNTHKTLITTIRAVSQLSTVFLFPVGDSESENYEHCWKLMSSRINLKKYVICQDKMI